MNLPPYAALQSLVAQAAANLPESERATIPQTFLKLLLQLALSRLPFDEQGYLKANPDVAAAVKQGQVVSGRMHFVGYGYFEGRTGGLRAVDTAWYERTYPDVAEALRSGKAGVATAEEHYRLAGAAEFRAPYADALEDTRALKQALGL